MFKRSLALIAVNLIAVSAFAESVVFNEDNISELPAMVHKFLGLQVPPPVPGSSSVQLQGTTYWNFGKECQVAVGTDYWEDEKGQPMLNRLYLANSLLEGEYNLPKTSVVLDVVVPESANLTGEITDSELELTYVVNARFKEDVLHQDNPTTKKLRIKKTSTGEIESIEVQSSTIEQYIPFPTKRKIKCDDPQKVN